ncbi:MAG: hypothetical protein ACREMQ_23295 [Longimicrobiales bacterium]
MHIQLTDILSCPRCGPEFGLILLADHIEERRVLAGTLGCASCQGKYVVRDGVADLRTAEHAAIAAAGGVAEAEDAAQRALRFAALMGVTEGPGVLLVIGPAAMLAPRIAEIVANVEVVAAGDAVSALPEQAGVSRIVVGQRLPFYSKRIRGITLSGAAAGPLLEEAARAVGPLGRLVLEPAPDDAVERLTQQGLRIVAQQGDTIVAARA